MCGICGVVSPARGEDELSQLVKPMTVSIQHRGPDDLQVQTGPGFAVGHTRLAIIDLIHGGQPMTDPRGYLLTYNGEVYNYRSVRAHLETLGERFETASDTEVVLKAYARWGPDALSRLDGIFAFAIVDTTRRELFLARDRLGVKPLYYAAVE